MPGLAGLLRLLILSVLVASPAHAQSGGGFDLSWNAVTGGGSTSSAGGGFDLGGSIGQGLAATSSGGDFKLYGGFWNPGAQAPVGVGEPLPGALRFVLLPARPNPLVATSTIEFELAETRSARLAIYDVTGQRVRLLVDELLAAGRQRVTWDGRSDFGAPVANGIYFARVQAGSFRASTRIVVLH
jgi:hypothetical protein